MTDLMSEEVANVLAQSREFIEKNGWSTGEYVVREWDGVGNPDDDYAVYNPIGYCAVGGILYSQQIDEYQVTTDPLVLKAVHALATSLNLNPHAGEERSAERCTCVINTITNWNDSLVEDRQEVLDAFAKAEKITRAGFDPDA